MVGSFHVQAQQRFGVGRPQVEPHAVTERDGQPVEMVDTGREPHIGLLDLGHRDPGVGDLGVDLTGERVRRIAVEQARQRPLLLAERGQDVHRGEHPGVGPPEVPEIEVTGVLATEDRTGTRHLRLDERMADAGPHRHAAEPGDELGHGVADDHIVNDRRTGLAGEFPLGDQRGDGGRRHALATFVDDEAAVRVTVEGEPDVGPGSANRGLQITQVRRLDRVGLVVGEGPVQFEVQRVDRQRQPLEHGRDGQTAHTVTRVHHDPQRSDGRQVDQGAQVLGVCRQQIAVGDRTARSGERGNPRLDHGADVPETGVRPDRSRAGPAQLDAVVLGRVVGCGEHRSRDVQRPGGEVEQVGRTEPDHDDIRALAGSPVGKRRRERDRRVTHVVRDDDPWRRQHVHERGSDRAGDIGVQL